jgi:hypothetical protein
MNLRLAVSIGAVALAGALGACEGAYYGPAGVYADVDYNGFYDGYYGPFNGGYWSDGGFYYWDAGRRNYRFDHGGHFRREAAPGFTSFHGHSPPGRTCGGRGGGGPGGPGPR